MINEIEYKLSGNEFKLLQFLKVNQGTNSLKTIQEKIGTTSRNLQRQVNVLHGLYIIEIEDDKGTNSYIVNDVEKWRIQ